jgi:hypothetical protein
MENIFADTSSLLPIQLDRSIQKLLELLFISLLIRIVSRGIFPAFVRESTG